MALRTAKSMLRRNPIVWNSGLYLTLYGTGEFTQQIFRPQNGINLRSIAHIGILGGFVFAPMYFSWYKFLDRLIVGSGLRFSLLKVACDQAICAPIAVAIFYVGLSALEGREDLLAELKLKFKRTYMAGCLFWPLLQTVNFVFIPSSLRAAYVACVAFVWTNILCYIKNLKTE